MNFDPPPGENDRDLLCRYAQEASAEAFAELVRRQVNPVYSAALRRVNGDHAMAEDVTQTVFADFARQAARIPADMPVGGWLHRHTGFVASKMIDRERRRRMREEKAAAMNSLTLSNPDPEWSAAAPLLDEALDALPAADRDAIVLRYFEQKDYRAVGAVLGVSDDTAQKKVSRALEKLRGLLSRRGIVSTGGALAALLAANAVGPAPSALAGELPARSLAAAAGAGRTLTGALAGLTIAARLKVAAAMAVLTAAGAGAAWLTARPVESRPANGQPAPELSGSSVSGTAAAQMAPGPAAVTAPVPLDVGALVAAAAEAWRDGRETVSSTAKALGFLSKVPGDQMSQALARAAAVLDEPARLLISKYLLSQWAETDPFGALAWADSEAAGPRQADLRQGVMDAWATRNPEAVMGWAGKTGSAQRGTRPEDTVLATVFRTLARRDPAMALARLALLNGSLERGQALRGITETVRSDSDRDRLFAAVTEIREDEIRVQARRALVEQWARRDAAAAAAYVEKAEPAWERTRLMDSLGLTWLQSNPAKAADWWVAHAPGPDTLVKVINVWAQQDPNAAGEWLRTHPAGPASDSARMTFSRQVADLDPESALRWAETVSDASMRESTIDHVFSNWHRRDAAAAAAFLNQSGWAAERTGRLQSKQ